MQFNQVYGVQELTRLMVSGSWFLEHVTVAPRPLSLDLYDRILWTEFRASSHDTIHLVLHLGITLGYHRIRVRVIVGVRVGVGVQG